MHDPGRILLISTYELGHQPLGLASPAAFLERAGFRPALQDLSLAPLDPASVRRAALVAISVPMHTALRLGVEVGRRVRALSPACHLAYYGLYATLNAEVLRGEGAADTILGGEFEADLVALARRLAADGDPGPRSAAASPALVRLDFPVPSRSRLEGLASYAHLERDGSRVPAGHLEASRGCLHHCRHCPIPPVYGGRFFIVPAEVVLADLEQLVGAGARHVTFGDPDFLNGPGHVLRIVREAHRRFPDLTFDITTKISNIVKHRALFPELAALGCAFVVSAVESLSDRVLAILAKGHTRADVLTALHVLRAAGIPLRPTFVAFTPWTTAADYLDLLAFVAGEDLADHVDPVQYALRLLLPPGSLLLAAPELAPHLGPLDRAAFTYRWTHPDPRLERLQPAVAALAERAARRGDDPITAFNAVRALAERTLLDREPAAPALAAAPGRRRPPRLTEDWFC